MKHTGKYGKRMLSLIIITCSILYGNENSKELFSPNKKINIALTIEGVDSSLVYLVKYQDKVVIERSRLGVNTAPKGVVKDTWQSKLAIVDEKYNSVDTTWKPIYGERAEVKDCYNEMILTLRNNNGTRGELQIIVRVYNEGIAFKYYFVEGYNAGGYVRIASDCTEFTMPEKTRGYFTSRPQGEYKYLPLSEWQGETERPLTLTLENGLFVSLAEAQAVNFCRTNFIIDERNKNKILCSMYDSVDDIEPFGTPWRIIMIAETAGGLVENNDIILNLNLSCEINETSWIKPGKVMRDMSLSTSGAKSVIDFAVKQNIQYILFDAGWYGSQYDVSQDATTWTVDSRRNPEGDYDLPEIIKYAKDNSVGVILYVNQRALNYQLDKILPAYKEWGVAGIKFGFVQVGSHVWTKWLHEAVKKCAEFNIMVDIHDKYRPTGFSRTYPNLMTQEGIRGNEEMPDATHNTIQPFTRYLAGAADYTFCYYYKEELGHPDRHIQTTSAHQLALPAIYYSPWQFLFWYDKPEDYQGEPELEFWKEIPTTWDDTKVLDSSLGEYVAIARKSGEEWFVGAITNTEARQFEIPLSFLDAGKEYETVIYYDDPNVNTRTHVGIKKIKADHNTKLNVVLKASGGEAIHIKPIK